MRLLFLLHGYRKNVIFVFVITCKGARIGVEYLTTGQICELSGISKKALFLYEEKGLLAPDHIDAETGYRYYSYRQCEKINLIKQMQSIGVSIADIREMFDGKKLAQFEQLLRDQITKLENQQRQISLALFSAKNYLEKLVSAQDTAQLDQFVLRQFPKRRALFIRNIANIYLDPTLANSKGASLEWENTLHMLREYMGDHHLPLSFASNASSMIEKEALLRRELYIKSFFIPVDDEFESDEISYIPEGSYLTFTPKALTNEDGALMEGYYINKMLDEIARSDCEVDGNYYAETIVPGYFSNVRHNVVRMQIAIKLAWSVFQHS